MKKLSLKELNRISPKEFKAKQKTPIVIIMDNVRSALNIGSSFRTADAFLLEGMYLCGITAKPPHREIMKTALGAEATVDWKYFSTSLEAVNELKAKGYKILAVEQADKSIPLQDFQPEANQGYAVIFGNEVNGVDDELMKGVDACLEVPQFGTKHSLNISVCLGIVVWDLFSKTNFKNGIK